MSRPGKPPDELPTGPHGAQNQNECSLDVQRRDEYLDEVHFLNAMQTTAMYIYTISIYILVVSMSQEGRNAGIDG